MDKKNQQINLTTKSNFAYQIKQAIDIRNLTFAHQKK